MITLNFIYTGEAKIFKILSNATWVINSASWLSFSTTSGTGDATITVTAQPNSGAQRTATINIVGNNGDCSETISVIQEASAVPSPFLNVSPSSLSFVFEGESKTFSITSNVNWNVSSSETWLTFTPVTSGNGDRIITATATNNTGNQRTATITITGDQGVASQTISVTQAAFVAGPYLDVNKTSISFGSSAGNNTFNIMSNVNWTVTCPDSWLQFTSSTTGNNNGTINFLVLINGTSIQRDTTITITGDQGVTSKTISVSQAAQGFGDNMFFMRFTNNTGNPVIVDDLRNLLTYYYEDVVGSGQFIRVETAIVERTGGIYENVRSGNQNILAFTVDSGESCIFRMTWNYGLFALMGSTNNSYKDICVSAGFKIKGNYNFPMYFMAALFYDCVNYNQQSGDVFDASELYGTSGDAYIRQFMLSTWKGCVSLQTATVPNTTNWNGGRVFIDDSFMESTWEGCISLQTAAVPNTRNWSVTGSIGNNFLYKTWSDCEILTTAVVPDTTNWTSSNIVSVGNNFMADTWIRCYRLTTAVVPNTTNWNIMSFGENFLAGTWFVCTDLVNTVVPDTTNWNVSYIHNNFMTNTWSTTRVITGVVPNTTNWTAVRTIGDFFMSLTWNDCPYLTTATVPNTTNWVNTQTIGNNFMYGTWYLCKSLTNVVAPDTSQWDIRTIGNNFMDGTWGLCYALVTSVAPDTSSWSVTSIGSNFMNVTWNLSFSNSSIGIVTLPGSLYTGSAAPISIINFKPAGLSNSDILNIKVDGGLVSTYQSRSDWTNITSSKFIPR
jgi:hypothetical protein